MIYAIVVAVLLFFVALGVSVLWCRQKQANSNLPKNVQQELLAAQMVERETAKLEQVATKSGACVQFDNPVYGEEEYAGYFDEA